MLLLSTLLPFLIATTTLALPAQLPLSADNDNRQAGDTFDPLKHLSAISPFFLPTKTPDPLPHQCKLKRVSLLIRHSSILGNDDEFEQTMQPFIEKVHRVQEDEPWRLPKEGEWAFLRDWETGIQEERLEELSDRGKRDAKMLGKYIRKQYGSLFPPKSRKPKGAFKKDKKGKGKEKKDKKIPAYKVWTASSPRDIESAKSYIMGSFPSHQSGEDGHGDGEIVQLVKVPNKAKDWDRSLTPHKACDTFDKKPSLEPANQWLSVYAPKVRERLRSVIPDFADLLVDQDILAMQMLCGYDTIALEKTSPFCSVLTEAEYYDFEYYMDVRFHYMMGYGNDLSPYLGMPWVKTALHLLGGKDGDDGGNHWGGNEMGEGYDNSLQPLPKPRAPPNATHTQYLHPSFTHRESPAFVSVFLNLYNASSHPFPAGSAPPLDHRLPQHRQWRTSHLTSFLGHVALERFSCDDDDDDDQFGDRKGGEGDFVRAVVNGKHEVMGGCEDGVDGSCKWRTWHDWVNARAERWGDWQAVCEKKD